MPSADKIDGDLNNVSYLTLTLIGDGGASPHDLVDMHRRGARIYYAVAASRSDPGRRGSAPSTSSRTRGGTRSAGGR